MTINETQRRADDAGAELSQLRQTIDSPGFDIVFGRIRGMILREQRALEQELVPDQTAKVRGSLQALRAVLALPDLLMEEARKRLEGKAG